MYLRCMCTSTVRASPRLVSLPGKLRLLVMLRAACRTRPLLHRTHLQCKPVQHYTYTGPTTTLY
eukprot:3097977-Amphidinium_carterae.1